MMPHVVMPLGFPTEHEAKTFATSLAKAVPNAKPYVKTVIEYWWHVYVQQSQLAKADVFYDGYIACKMYEPEPTITCVCGARNPTTAEGDDGLERCTNCGAH